MSYIKSIDSYVVTFKDEVDYLNCRIDYLEYCKSCEDSYQGEGVANVFSFLGYIESEMYDISKCEVESIAEFDATAITAITATSTTIPNSTVNYDINPCYEISTTIPTVEQPFTNLQEAVGDNIIYYYDNIVTNFTIEEDKDDDENGPIESRFDILDL